MKLIILLGIALLTPVACKKEGSFSPTDNRDKGANAENDAILNDPALANLNKDEIFCLQGPRITKLVEKADFTEQFALVCDNKSSKPTTNSSFDDLIQSAYEGEGEPKVKILSSSTNEQFVTDITLGYAIKVPMANPSLFSDYKAHNIFATGVITEDSKMIIDVAARKEFPGRRSIEAVTLNYDIKTAKGAAIYDKRQTEFNTYLLKEDYRQVVLSTEHLLDADNNPNYHATNGLTIGVQAEEGYTHIVFLSNLVIKNRIDPSRLEAALIDLNADVAKKLYNHIIDTNI